MTGTGNKPSGGIVTRNALSSPEDAQEAVIPLAVIKKRYCLVCRGKGWTKRWVAKGQIHTRLHCNACNGKGFVRRLPVELISIAPVAVPINPVAKIGKMEEPGG